MVHAYHKEEVVPATPGGGKGGGFRHAKHTHLTRRPGNDINTVGRITRGGERRLPERSPW